MRLVLCGLMTKGASQFVRSPPPAPRPPPRPPPAPPRPVVSTGAERREDPPLPGFPAAAGVAAALLPTDVSGGVCGGCACPASFHPAVFTAGAIPAPRP